MLRYLTAGESHGKCLTAILDGVPANLVLSEDDINEELRRRQVGYGRGGRMSIERDIAEITSGVRFGKTIGSPVAMIIKNRDWQNWKEIMNVGARGKPAPAVSKQGGQGARGEEVTRPRPGHADLAGVLKYRQYDIRNILERSSARETAARVAIGAICKSFLDKFGIKVMSWVVEIGGIRSQKTEVRSLPSNVSPIKAFGDRSTGGQKENLSSVICHLSSLFELAEVSDVRCPDKAVAEKMRKTIDRARKSGDSIGGIFEVAVTGVPPGLGSHVQWDRKLDGNLARSLMSIQAIKGVEIGMGFGVTRKFGSEVHDEIFYRSQKKNLSSVFWPLSSGFYRKTNNAGGIEGGMSNGEPIILRAAMKPIPTLYKPLRSVDIKKKKSFAASVERSDICAVPAASVIGEAVVAFEIANAFVEKLGGDSIEEIKRNYKSYLEYLRRF